MYLLRSISTGLQATVLALGTLLIFRFLPGGDAVPGPIFFGVWIASAAGGIVVARLPWPRLFDSGLGMPALYVWSLLDVALITAIVIAAGDANPGYFNIYFLTTLFFAPIYPLRMQILLFMFTAVSYVAAVAIVHPTLTPADHFLRVALLGIAGFMVRFNSAEHRQQQEALERSNSLLKATLESTADGILVVDRTGRMVAFNQRFVDMWRIPQEVVDSREDERALAVVAGQLVDPEGFLKKVQSLYQDATTESFDEVFFKDGRVFERLSKPRVVDGQLEGRVWSFRAVTESRRRAQQVREALEALRDADAERRRLLTHLVQAKEDERSRVAADIHDDSVQVMTSVAIELERLERQIDDPSLASSLSHIEDRVRSAVQRLRSMVFELKPPSLMEEGLVPALTLYLEELSAESGIRYELTKRLEDEPPGDLKVVLYRISQEALTNVRKHSGATKVDVELVQSNRSICLHIADDGRGLSAPPGASPGHIGVTEMRERAEMAGGTFEMRQGDAGGAVVEVHIPLPRTDDRAISGLGAQQQ